MVRLSMLLLAAVLFAGAARAEPPDPAPPAPDIVGENIRRFLHGLRRLIDQVPMFEAPRITPDGDILLRRIHPPAPDADEAKVPHEHDGVDL
jgi:hypothetical protein